MIGLAPHPPEAVHQAALSLAMTKHINAAIAAYHLQLCRSHVDEYYAAHVTLRGMVALSTADSAYCQVASNCGSNVMSNWGEHI